MKLTQRAEAISESITLKLNAKAVALSDSGKKIYNLTAGQLPFRPMSEFTDLIRNELDFLKSYQYSPVAGFPELRTKLIDYVEDSRDIKFSDSGVEFDCIVSNGGKHALSNIMAALVEEKDEVILLAPYWVSYPEMVRYCKGTVKVVSTTIFDAFVPSIDDIRSQITDKTKLIVINSPSNPSGIHYSAKWMDEFAEMIIDFPNISIISDEIYYELNYFDPRPTYFYQGRPELLARTIIVDGISKNLACTGLRLGYCIAPKPLVKALTKLQGQTTSGCNSLVQKALINYDFKQIKTYLGPIKIHLRENSQVVMEKFRDSGLAKSWYQSQSAFYYIVDFSKAPVIKKYRKSEDDTTDYSDQISEELLENYGVAIVPGGAFGIPNAARISLVLQPGPFNEALDLLMKFMLE